ncbi:hypothetical protein [Halovivax cerinus]|uniref:DUF350 domain-containing protein n=1 Tax=Halovivax cerinus TaxID=1487865 RepID=A0ABD5NN16_9EURY|nr:hypothetical protein [Halovivax cerinus]
MFSKITDPIYDTLMNGKIVNRLVLILGIVLVLYGAYTILGFYGEIWNQLLKNTPRQNTLAPVLTAFLSVIVGLVAVVLGTVADFSWNPDASH